jgi:hypothetical protein
MIVNMNGVRATRHAEETQRILREALADSSLSVDLGIDERREMDGTTPIHLTGPAISHAVDARLIPRAQLYALIADVGNSVARTRQAARTVLVVPAYVPEHASRRLRELGINYADSHGNTHLALPGLLIHVRRGLRRTRNPRDARSRDPLLRPAGVKLLFSLLVTPARGRTTQRELAHRAGLSPGAVNRALREMSDWGHVKLLRRGVQLTDLRNALDLFAQSYRSVLWHRLLRERFASDLEDFRAGLSEVRLRSPTMDLALSGDFGAEILHQEYRGLSVVVHSMAGFRRFAGDFRLRPDKDGSIFDMRAFGVSGEPWRHPDRRFRSLAHPALIYADLVAEGSPRGLDIARDLRPLVEDACEPRML